MTGNEYAFVVLAVSGPWRPSGSSRRANVVHAALYLVSRSPWWRRAYLLLAAEFIAWVQILIYVGAIVILFLFGLMLTKAPIGREALDNQRRGVAVVVALAILAGLVFLIQDAFAWDGPKIDPVPASDGRGRRVDLPAATFCRSRWSRSSCSPR